MLRNYYTTSLRHYTASHYLHFTQYHTSDYICVRLFACLRKWYELNQSQTVDRGLPFTFLKHNSHTGCPTDDYSDNDKIFSETADYLISIFQITEHFIIHGACKQRQILWHFSAPSWPNFGDVWESSIKLSKRHLVKAVRAILSLLKK